MNRNKTTWRHRLPRFLAAAGTLALLPAGAFAQERATAAAAPSGVLLFPVVVAGADAAATQPQADAAQPNTPGGAAQPSPAVRERQDIATEALRRALGKVGIRVVTYDRRLPSVQRAVNEGTLRAEDAAAGPGDDPRKAQRLADLIGASEYITVELTDYKYDSASRTAAFNLNVFRNAAEGAPLGTSAVPAKEAAPADVPAPRQEGSATARAAERAAEEAVAALFPRAAVPQETPEKKPQRQSSRRGVETGFLVGVGALLAALIIAD